MTPTRDREALDQAIARGSEALKRSQLDQAVRAFRQGLEIDPGNPRILALLGLTYFRAGQFGEARPIYEQLVERTPNDASHRLNLGLVYLKLGDADRALSALEASRALDPSQGRAVSYLGLAYARAGRYAEAYRSFLLAGQIELASEIEINLPPTERDAILVQLGRPPGGATAAAADPRAPASGAPASAAPLSTPESVMRALPTPPLPPAPPAVPTPPAPPPPPPRAATAPPVPPPVPAPSRPPPPPPPAAAAAAALPAVPSPISHRPSERHQAARPPGLPGDRDRHSSPTAPIVPRPGHPPTPAPPLPAIARTTSQRAITQNIVPRASLEEAGSTRAKTDPRLKPPGARPRTEDDAQARPAPAPSGDPAAPEITITRGQEPTAPRARSAAEDDDVAVIEIGPPQMTESQQFVMASREAVAAAPRPEAGRSMVSTAVAAAAPAALAAAGRTPAGGRPPRPLAELATEGLVRPDEGDDRIEIAPGGNLVIRIVDRMMVRLEGVHVTGGDLTYEPATRRTRGHQTDERFDHGGASLHVVSGRGYLMAMPGKHAFEAVALDDDILYVREDLVYAFEATLRWENGNVPGLRGKLPVVQFRGHGALALRIARPLVRVKLPHQGLLFIDAERLAGWIGRVIPRAVVPPRGGPLGAMCVECTGEGVVLIEPLPEPGAPAAPEPAGRRRSATVPPPPPPAAQALGPEDFVSEQEARPSLPPELIELGDDDRI